MRICQIQMANIGFPKFRFLKFYRWEHIPLDFLEVTVHFFKLEKTSAKYARLNNQVYLTTQNNLIIAFLQDSIIFWYPQKHLVYICHFIRNIKRYLLNSQDLNNFYCFLKDTEWSFSSPPPPLAPIASAWQWRIQWLYSNAGAFTRGFCTSVNMSPQWTR